MATIPWSILSTIHGRWKYRYHQATTGRVSVDCPSGQPIYSSMKRTAFSISDQAVHQHNDATPVTDMLDN